MCKYDNIMNDMNVNDLFIEFNENRAHKIILTMSPNSAKYFGRTFVDGRLAVSQAITPEKALLDLLTRVKELAKDLPNAI